MVNIMQNTNDTIPPVTFNSGPIRDRALFRLAYGVLMAGVFITIYELFGKRGEPTMRIIAYAVVTVAAIYGSLWLWGAERIALKAGKDRRLMRGPFSIWKVFYEIADLPGDTAVLQGLDPIARDVPPPGIVRTVAGPLFVFSSLVALAARAELFDGIRQRFGKPASYDLLMWSGLGVITLGLGDAEYMGGKTSQPISEVPVYNQSTLISDAPMPMIPAASAPVPSAALDTPPWATIFLLLCGMSLTAPIILGAVIGSALGAAIASVGILAIFLLPFIYLSPLFMAFIAGHYFGRWLFRRYFLAYASTGVFWGSLSAIMYAYVVSTFIEFGDAFSVIPLILVLLYPLVGGIVALLSLRALQSDRPNKSLVAFGNIVLVGALIGVLVVSKHLELRPLWLGL
ncbi:MAG: hypothetical protein JWM37_840 [Candidatus Saccharibacteria bacterium]|nr:hypothetical protein [Candidatus Saccharibacteria bacterium]